VQAHAYEFACGKQCSVWPGLDCYDVKARLIGGDKTYLLCDQSSVDSQFKHPLTNRGYYNVLPAEGYRATHGTARDNYRAIVE
jgi:hypothetical protein